MQIYLGYFTGNKVDYLLDLFDCLYIGSTEVRLYYLRPWILSFVTDSRTFKHTAKITPRKATGLQFVRMLEPTVNTKYCTVTQRTVEACNSAISRPQEKCCVNGTTENTNEV